MPRRTSLPRSSCCTTSPSRVDGTGTGNVTSDVGGIDCPATNCVAPGPHPRHARDPDGLARPRLGLRRDGATTDAAAASLTCDVTMDSRHDGHRDLLAVRHAHRHASAAAGGGTVTSPPGNEINCPAACALRLRAGRLGDPARRGRRLLGVRRMEQRGRRLRLPGDGRLRRHDGSGALRHGHVPADRRPDRHEDGGSGTGTVTSLAPNLGIDCGATCQFNFQQGVSVSLHASRRRDSTFVGWSGGGCSGTTDCIVTMSGAQSVNAQFDVVNNPPPVTIPDNDPAVAYNGWVGVADPNANGGFYRTSKRQERQGDVDVAGRDLGHLGHATRGPTRARPPSRSTASTRAAWTSTPCRAARSVRSTRACRTRRTRS